jgi:uncharacterized membrane protein
VFSRPAALYWMAAPALVALWGILNAGSLRRMAAPSMRAAALALFVLALAAPERVFRSEGAARPAVIDASASITAAMRSWTARLIGDDLNLRAADPAIVFGADAESTSIGAALTSLKANSQCESCVPSATNLEAAILKLAADPDAHGGPAVIVTDGWENAGDASRALNALAAAQIRLDIFTPPGAKNIANVAMTELAMPQALVRSEPFALGVTMENLNDRAVTGTITIARDGAAFDSRRVTLTPGSQRFDFTMRNESAGLTSYIASFKPDDAALDVYPEDDSLQGWVGIGARRKVLILTDSTRDAEYLKTAIDRMGLEPTVVSVSGAAWNGSPAGYDAVLLNNVSANQISTAAQSAMAEWVRRGGALAMTGGDASFGLGGWGSSPLAEAMPVVMKPPQHRERKRALVLIIDKSGSMGRDNKLTYAKASAVTVTKTLKDADLIEVIGFDSQAFVVVPMIPFGQTRNDFDQMVGLLTAHGTTNLIPALRQAEHDLASSGAQVRHVVILTDGGTGGTTDMYYDLVSRMHHDGGATISTIAVGKDVKEHDDIAQLLQSIAKYGGGAYYQTDSPNNLPQLFVEDFRAHGGETTMVENNFVPLTTAHDPVLKDLAGRRMPPIKGYVSTDLKPRADLSMFVDRAGARDPIVASWKYGAGKTIAVTTDASGRWSGPWIAANIFQPLWNRLIGWMTPESASAPKIDVALGYQSGRLRIKLTDYAGDTAPAGRVINAVVTRPDTVRTETVLTEDVPGELSGSIQAHEPGTYKVEIRTPLAKGEKFPPLAYTLNTSVNAELPRPEPNFALLEKIASATGGRLNPNVSEVASARPVIERRESLNPFFIAAAMVLLILEALVRRLNA